MVPVTGSLELAAPRKNPGILIYYMIASQGFLHGACDDLLQGLQSHEACRLLL
jgi:hypothetical protein